MTKRDVIALEAVDERDSGLVGGKGANLGALSRIEGVRVPAGFCVTTHAFGRVVANEPPIIERLAQLSRLGPDDREAIGVLSAEIRRTVESIAVPDDLTAAIGDAVARLGDRGVVAVRSSATAEDLPTASFAGQHDSYLNVAGLPAIVRHVRRCWASLYSERAVIYRQRHGIDHRMVHMAVVVQRMIMSRAAGVVFTADPVTGHRGVASVEAVVGLGEALVAGTTNADIVTVRDDEVVASSIRQQQPVLTDAQAVRLVRLGRRIERHFGHPQDIEWCLERASTSAPRPIGPRDWPAESGDHDDFVIVQSRPITTLFPIPTSSDRDNHVYVSVGHQQMMTDPIKPLGISVWQLTARRPMHEAGARLFVDVTRELASPASAARLVAGLGKSDPLIGDALQSIVDRGDFVAPVADVGPAPPPAGGAFAPIETDAAIVDELIARTDASIAALRRDIGERSGADLLDVILADIDELKQLLSVPQSTQVIMAGMEALWWLNDHLLEWLGEQHAADILTQSVPNNVTSQMGLALLDVADAIRPHPAVVAFLEGVGDDFSPDDLDDLDGGPQARHAIEAWLDDYGMRCVGEIDITRPRWSERPALLVPVILGNVKNFEPGAGVRRFEQGRRDAWAKEQELLGRLRDLPDGDTKADETERTIHRMRTFIGYREHPKYGIVRRYFVYKQALLREAERLVQRRVLGARDDIFFLTFQELHDVVRTGDLDHRLVERRKVAFTSSGALTPPRVLTSDGEIVTGTYRRDDAPSGALIGLPVSAGTVDGRARVVFDMAGAELEPGDILVTTYTDPSWTPLFVAIAGLVTEVGGLMTHGAVIAREYGLPAVVGVEHATQLIADGQRIRVHGTDGYVELLA